MTVTGKHTVSYGVYDYAGNKARLVDRTVEVYDPCTTSGEVMCPDLQLCSVLGGNCTRNAVLSLGGQTTASTGGEVSTEPVYGSAEDIVYDDTAPVITPKPLLATRFITTDGEMSGVITNITVGSVYVEYGCTTSDEVDINVQSKLVIRGVDIIDTSRPSGNSPYIISYNAMDFSGNPAVSKYRLVFVSCATGQVTCTDATTDNLYCAETCGVVVASSRRRSLLQTEEVLPDFSNTVLAQLINRAPSIILEGLSTQTINAGDVYKKCPSGSPPAEACDPGAIAIDTEDGLLTTHIKVCQRAPFGVGGHDDYLLVGLSACGFSEATPPGVYEIDFLIYDSFGAEAIVYRTLIIQENCDPGEELCGSYTCTSGGVCLDGTAPLRLLTMVEPLRDGPPTVSLINYYSLGPTVKLVRGATFDKCAVGQFPDEGMPCELGVTAIAANGNNLRLSTYACPPKTCLDSCNGCFGYEFVSKGIKGCLDSTAAAGTPITIAFVVCDNQSPPERTVVVRVIEITALCVDDTPYECDGECYTVPCAYASKVNTTTPDEGKVVLTLQVDSTFFDFNDSNATSEDASGAYTVGRVSTAVTITSGILQVFLEYGVDSGSNYAPCASSTDTSDCSAFAIDALSNDVTPAIVVFDTSCSDPGAVAAGTCFSCTPEAMSLGACAPGNYSFMYVAVSASGRSTTNLSIHFVVEEYVHVPLELTVLSGAANATATLLQLNLETNRSTLNAAVLAALPGVSIAAADVRHLDVLSIDVVAAASGGTWSIGVKANITLNATATAKAAALAAGVSAGRRRTLLAAGALSAGSGRSLIADAEARVAARTATAGADDDTTMHHASQWHRHLHAAAPMLELPRGDPATAAALALSPVVRARAMLVKWVRNQLLPSLAARHDSMVAGLAAAVAAAHDVASSSEYASDEGSSRALLESSGSSAHERARLLLTTAEFNMTLSYLGSLQMLSTMMVGTLGEMNATVDGMEAIFTNKDLSYESAIEVYNEALDLSYSRLASIMTTLPDTLLKPGYSTRATTLAAAQALLTVSSTLLYETISSVALTTLDVLSDNTGINYTASSDAATYVTCLVERANGARFGIKVFKYTPPSLDYVAAALAAVALQASQEGSISGRRRMSSVNAFIPAADLLPSGMPFVGAAGGYPIAEAYATGSPAAWGWGEGVPEGSQRSRIVGNKGNAVLGGLLLHQTRRDISKVIVTPNNRDTLCVSANEHLVNGCLSPESRVYNFQDDGWFGLDPAFYNRSSLFKQDIMTRQYYNTTVCLNAASQACGEVDRHEMPLGFEPVAMAGLPDGYPLLFDNHVPLDRARELLTYMSDGAFLDPKLSKELTVRLATYNADARAFGFGKATFRWGRVGVSMSAEIQSVPAVDYSRYIEAGDYSAFIPDWVILGLCIFYLIYTTVNVLKSYRAQGQIQDESPNASGLQMTPEEVFQRKVHAKTRVQARMSWVWVVYEYTICTLMVAAIGLQFYYIFDLSPNAPTSLRYDVYDADIFSPAHYFMLKRNDTAFSASEYASHLGMGLGQSFGSATSAAQPNGMPSPGDPFRWALPVDTTGLDGLATMYAAVQKMVDVYAGYAFCQGVVLTMLMLRLIVHLSFQPKLGMLSRVLMRTAPDVAHFALLLVVIASMFAMVVTLIYGYRVESVSSFGLALQAVLEYIVVKSGKTATESFGVGALMPSFYNLRTPERLLAYLVFFLAPFYCIYVMLNFFVAMILYPYVWIKHNDDRAGSWTGVWTDLSFMFKCTKQEGLDGAPTNKRLEETVSWLLMPKIGNNWWYNTIFKAVVSNTTSRYAGPKMAANRLSAGKEKEKMIELGEQALHARYNFPRLLRQMDAFFSRDPTAEAQAVHLLSDPRVRQGKLYRLVQHLRKRASSRTATALNTIRPGSPPIKGALSVRPMSPGMVPRGSPGGALGVQTIKGMARSGAGAAVLSTANTLGATMKDRGEDVAPDAADLDAAGSMARLLIQRFGIALPKQSPRDLDEFMAQIRFKLRSPGTPDVYGYSPYGAYGGYASPSLVAGRQRGAPPQDLMAASTVRRMMWPRLNELAEESGGDAMTLAGMLAERVPAPSGKTAARFDSPDQLLAHALLKAINGNRTPDSPGEMLRQGLGPTNPEEAAAMGLTPMSRLSTASTTRASADIGSFLAYSMAVRPETPINVQTIAAELMAAANMVRGLGNTSNTPQYGQQYGQQYSQQQATIAGSFVPLPPPGGAPRPRGRGDVNNPVAKALMAAISGKAIDQAELQAYEDKQLEAMLQDLDKPIMPLGEKSSAGPSSAHPKEIVEEPSAEQMTRLQWQQEQVAEAERRNAEREAQLEAKRAAARAVAAAIAKLTNDAADMAAQMRVVQTDVTRQLKSTNAILDAIVTRRFMPKSLAKRSSPDLPGTPTHGRSARNSAAGGAWTKIGVDAAIDGAGVPPASPRSASRLPSRKEHAVVIPGLDDGGLETETLGSRTNTGTPTGRSSAAAGPSMSASPAAAPKSTAHAFAGSGSGRGGGASGKSSSPSTPVAGGFRPAMLGPQLMLQASRLARERSALSSPATTSTPAVENEPAADAGEPTSPALHISPPPPMPVRDASSLEPETEQLPAEFVAVRLPTATPAGLTTRHSSTAADLPELGSTEVVAEAGTSAAAAVTAPKKKKKKTKDGEGGATVDEDGNPVKAKKKKKSKEPAELDADGNAVPGTPKEKKKKEVDADGNPVKKKKKKEPKLDADGNPIPKKKKANTVATNDEVTAFKSEQPPEPQQQQPAPQAAGASGWMAGDSGAGASTSTPKKERKDKKERSVESVLRKKS
ncbi:hypothetical protein FOA52_015057 [Chlamydomonas sp. UWO 241]|nr:hypothetical protein FOA52_015057 [Chlamydomonas sp. UWO 241]